MSDWDKTCALCADGEIEPDCPFYGEPNGCNSPTYQHFPTGECNAKLAIQALTYIVAYWEEGKENKEREHELLRQAKAALAAPPRNCDVGTAEEQAARLRQYCLDKDSLDCRHYCMQSPKAFDCSMEWAQMPYEQPEEETNEHNSED